MQELNYRVQTVNDLPALLRRAQSEGPMLAVVDLDLRRCQSSLDTFSFSPSGATRKSEAGRLRMAD
jgi:hypothetical protein